MAETQIIEWKKEWKDEYLEWICGFANAHGGKLIIGIDDQGKAFGVKDKNKLMKDLPNTFRQTMGLVLDVNLKQHDGKDCIEIIVPAYPTPISYRGRYYYRSGATNQLLTGTELDLIMHRKKISRWESTPLPGLRFDDLDDRLIEDFKKKAIEADRLDKMVLTDDKEIFARRLGLIENDFLTNAAALLFTKEPDYYMTGAYIKLAFFETDADIIYQDRMEGSLFEQVDQTISTLYKKYLKAKISYKGIQRVERYPYPIKASREAILNAAIHKDYSRAIPVQISVYDGKLYVGNVGQLPITWTLEDLLNKHISDPYNPVIARAFYLAGYIEHWGRGIEMIMNACRDDGIDPPTYKIHPGDIMICFTAPADRIIPSGQRVETEVTDKVTDKVTDREIAILNLLKENNRYTVIEIAKKLSLSRKTIMKRLKILQESGMIRRVGANRSGYWEVVGDDD
ncbi:MAG: putative DNA binding domain-containing protein [Gracilibacteraceae bacterium]|jgi:ATP-dependent DNA helicase RecG|nr:putative DNA binding domain-containing protein [Gracilibacteraceae bacterium]